MEFFKQELDLIFGEEMILFLNIDYLYDYADSIIKDPNVDQVSSIVSTKPRLSKLQYAALYTHAQDNLNPSLKK